MVTVTRRRFEELVSDALDSIPREIWDDMENVAVLVEDWPAQGQGVAGGRTLLGLYEGVPVTKRGPIGYSGVMPDRITIFRGPLCERARDEEDLAAQVHMTVLHEVGHYFGMTDERLRELGWA